ncbi:efflux RND transporter periplasmic adaptor subunit [Roseibium sp.]|uniref:efflux RND transporter periplasmic adaptor subunit n=1 Tax=Roseibium sp. TaxID=1936156 RepID=UPI003A976CB6
MRFLRLTVFLFLIGAAAALTIWWTNKPPEVGTARPFRGTAVDVVYATAVVEPVTWAKVTSVIRKRIVDLCGCEGAAVKEGDELARLDSGDARATLKELEARQLLAQADRERAFELLERRVVSQQVYDKAQSQLVQVNALIAAQKERLRDYVITAPMDGTVLRQDGAVGEVAEPGDILFWIGPPTPLQLIAEVNEEDIPKVEPGQRALIRADAFPNTDLEATVARITPKGDPVLKNYRVYLDLPQETPLRIGMTVELNILTRQVEDALLIPVAAIDGTQIMTIDPDGRVRTSDIEIGIRGSTSAEVLAGLDQDALIVSPFDEDLEDGDKVSAGPEQQR